MDTVLLLYIPFPTIRHKETVYEQKSYALIFQTQLQ
jgi:hypothetical protein